MKYPIKKILTAIEYDDKESTVHVRFPEDSENLVSGIIRESGIKVEHPEARKIVRKNTEGRKIIFSHRRALGDGLMFTAGIRDFKLLFPEIEINVDSNQSILWENNPYINRELKKEDPGVEFYKVGYPMVGNANNTAMHFSTMFLFDMIAMTDLHEELPISLGEFCSAFANGNVGDKSLSQEKNIEQHGAREPFLSLGNKYGNFFPKKDKPGEYDGLCKEFVRQRGDIHLTEEEKQYNMVQDIYGVDKYWVIAPGGKRDCTCKIWDWRQFQEVINHFKGRLKFAVIGRSDHIIEKLDGVIDLVDKFNGEETRKLIPLVYHAEGCVSGPSFLMHLAAAMPPRFDKERKPCVSILGGREPSAWTWYCNHQVLHTNGIYSCCNNGGCWKARTHPLPKDPEHNKSLCKKPVEIEGRTVPSCMNSIESLDVIRAIDKYYDGDIYTYSKKEINTGGPVIVDDPKPFVHQVPERAGIDILEKDKKEINLLGNLNTSGGGEQSLLKIASVLRKAGWKVNLHPWGSVHDNYKNEDIMDTSFKDQLRITPKIPLLYYANDTVWDFAKKGKELVDLSSSVIIGINYVNGSLPKCDWLAMSGKLKAVIFQNEEKLNEWKRDQIGFDDTKLINLFGAIDLDKFYEVCTSKRKSNKDELVVLKHCKPDYRKYVTEESKNNGDKIHIWQKHCYKDLDTKFYERLLKNTKNIRFEFMEAHKELVKYFEKEDRMVFHKWNSLDVGEFLSRGHVYLYRTSNMWRDQYPRTVGEALAAGLPVLTEPRDGTKDRVTHGDTGLYCIDFDGFLYGLKLLQRKEDYRYKMGLYAKDWAKENLNPNKWANVVEDMLWG